MSGTSGRAGQWRGQGPALARDPVLLGMLALTVLAGLLFVSLAGRADWQLRVFWIFQPPTDLVLAVCSWRLYRFAIGAVRRFWLVVAVAGALFTAGDTYQSVLSVISRHGISTNGGTVQTTCFAVGLGLVVVAMIAHPHPNRSGRERLAFWLDSATVLVGGAVVAWCFLGTPDNPDIAGTVAAAGVSITGTFAAVKLTLSGNSPMSKPAALTMIASAVAMSAGVFLAPAAVTVLAPLVYLLRFLPSVLIAAGPRIQEVVAHLDPAYGGQRRRKPYSLLPYGSMAVAFGSLVMVLPGGPDAQLWGVVAGLGLICALVAARQLVSFHDNTALIGRLREQEAQLRQLAHFDGLTGLANRTHFHERVTAALGGSGTVSLLLLDLDGFKAVNDTMGHAAGDALLAGVAGKLRDAVREQDFAARLGGDEFAVLLPDCPAGEAERTAQRILEGLRTPIGIGGVPVPVNASIGVADAEAGDDVESLLHDADLAMYAAKGGGKGTWVRHHAGLSSNNAA